MIPRSTYPVSLLLFLVLSGSVLLAQDGPPPLRIGLGYTGTAYRGDFTTEPNALWRAEPGGNLSVDIHTQRPLRFQFQLGFGGFSEQADAPLPLAPEGIVPNRFVRTSFFYTDVRLQYRFLRQARIQPYVAAGAGLFSFQPRDAQGNFLGENFFSRLPEESYLTLLASVPVSAGAEWHFSQWGGLGLEYTYRMTGSDYLDNIGLLGEAPGNDRLHSLQVKLLLVVGRDAAAPSVMPLPVEIPAEVAEEAPAPVYYRYRDGQVRER